MTENYVFDKGLTGKLRLRDIKDLPVTIKRRYKTGVNIAHFETAQLFYDSILCDEPCMSYLKTELGALDSDCGDHYSFEDMLEVYCRKSIHSEVHVGERLREGLEDKV